MISSIPLVGYADRFSVLPGETIAFKVSSTAAAPFAARLVRIVSADPNPAGPGLVEQDVPAAFTGDYPSRPQPVRLGSYMRVAEPAALDGLQSFTLAATIWPTTPAGSQQGVLARWAADAARGFALAIDSDGAVALLGDGQGRRLRLAVGKPLVERRWYRIWASYDAGSRRLTVGQAPVHPRPDADDTGSAGATADFAPALDAPNDRTGADLFVAALGGEPVTGHYNGKIERPLIVGAALAEADALAVAAGRQAPEDLVAAWDFGQAISTAQTVDTGPHGLHGRLVNMPARGMVGAAWDGSELCWRHAPAHYAAIHFHDDDIHDCGWQTDFSFTVPDDLPSGIYGARLTCEGVEETIPFFVRAPRGKPRNPLCVLIPTFTYIVYTNHARGNLDEAFRKRIADWGARPWNPDEHREFGLSTYNAHSDGSGICYASRLRPALTIRPNYLTLGDLPGSGLRHFSADSHLWWWLEQQGHGFDVLTDEDLHAEGSAALADYRVVMTTSHPEYHTPGTLDALQGYVDGGGRLMYLGGNGFYWKVAVSDAFPGAVEIRRGEGGIRAWAAEPGEYHNSLDGTYGGLWRRNGRPPQLLCGVGFSGQGLLQGSYYRRKPASYAPEYAWMFAGIDAEIIGDFGLSGGGAAGYELDRADIRLGTPLNAVVLATSEAHQSHFVVVPEELLTHTTTWTGEAPEDLIRADIVYFETEKGGAVFSTGSICFCGSLPWNGGDNNIARLVDNVLRRFRDG